MQIVKDKRRRRQNGKLEIKDIRVNDPKFISENSVALESLKNEVKKFTENCQNECLRHGAKVKVTIIFEF